MGVINKEWHAAHRMPVKPAQNDRAAWQAAHVEECGCRTPSEKEQALIEAWRQAHPRP